LSEGQSNAILEIESGKRFSLYGELRVTLYFGVMCILDGVGLSIQRYYEHLGHIAIIAALSIAFLGAFVFCFIKGEKYSKGVVKS